MRLKQNKTQKPEESQQYRGSRSFLQILRKGACYVTSEKNDRGTPELNILALVDRLTSGVSNSFSPGATSASW